MSVASVASLSYTYKLHKNKQTNNHSLVTAVSSTLTKAGVNQVLRAGKGEKCSQGNWPNSLHSRAQGRPGEKYLPMVRDPATKFWE